MTKSPITDAHLDEAQKWICRRVQEAGGRAHLVGGCVRDLLMGRPVNDIDVEIFGVEPDALQTLLAERFEVSLVGKAFGVLKIHGLPIDVSIPRREVKAGTGHKGFDIDADPNLSVEEAARRRDFTINAVAWNPLADEWIDPYDGRRDLQDGVLRHVSDKFIEDPLRVLRAAQFTARFDLKVADETVALCREIEPESLPRERIWEEWKKLILLGRKISAGLELLRACGWIRYTPELEALVGCEQEPEWHPEGDVWVHTGHAMDAFARDRVGDEWEDLVVGLAVLCHDFGKPATTRLKDGRIRSPRHEPQGAAPTRAFIERMTNQEDLIEQVVPLVTCHLRPYELHRSQASDSAIRRLARKVGRLDRLVRVACADMQARPPLPFDDFPAGTWLLERAEALEIADSAPQPIVMGRDLIALGLAPGPSFSPILDACYEAQLDGEFLTHEEGLTFAKKQIEGVKDE